MILRRSIALLILGWLVVMAGPSGLADDAKISARAFKIDYRSLSDAADLVGEVLSDDGSVTIKPRLRTLVVEDRVAVLDRVSDLIESFDVPPQRVEATLSLFIGRRKPESGEGAEATGSNRFSEEVRGVIETLRDVTQWNEYQPLGSRSIDGLEGEPVVADIAPNFRVQFKIGKVDDARGVIKFDRFALQRIPTPDSNRPIEDLYTAAMVVESGKLTMVVAARAKDSKEAIFLALKVDPR